ncbi:GNAT family N-acetyltransferase [Nocardiopsis metallicus]|uniref:Diamine N-acetyltransferase n=1 Tax=Nocardiopsis metallicus TaxID=179819 RepID=A0A840WKK0_9ACTN|nr:GNAT family N-acetyltransferase [Nocardiopsis metallicus]MBB5490628.1 diamine N-acetyltransferase [Nocardiopsis metallicus]
MTEAPSPSQRAPRLVEITDDNFDAAVRVQVREDQNRFVAPVLRSLAQAYTNRDTAWPRLLMDGDEAVGFMMLQFDPEEEDPDFQAEIWRLNIDEKHQGKGYGRFAVEGALAEARRRGLSRVTVSWVPGEASPEDFYLGLGFRKTGRVEDSEVIGEIFLD